MSDPQLLHRAHARAHLAAVWATCVDLPDTVLAFLAEDVPWLLEVAHAAAVDGGPPGPTRLAHAVAAHHLLAHVIDKVRLADAAQDIPGLWEACEADIATAIDRLCPRRQRALLEIAVRELAGTNWDPKALAGEEETKPC
jgi:hypothetical protein